MGIENMDFGPGHHGGMPTAEELRWREAMERAEIEARYYPFGRESQERPSGLVKLREVVGMLEQIRFGRIYRRG